LAYLPGVLVWPSMPDRRSKKLVWWWPARAGNVVYLPDKQLVDDLVRFPGGTRVDGPLPLSELAKWTETRIWSNLCFGVSCGFSSVRYRLNRELDNSRPGPSLALAKVLRKI
jgi:hypothetical protein